MGDYTVRIAVSGTHRTGKSTLVAEIGARLPGYRIVPEPYETLEERGYDFEYPPSVEDFVAQLRLSIATLRRPWPNAMFDRCPLDFLGYISATRGADRFDLERWRDPITAAMRGLDLVVALHIDRDNERDLAIEDAAYRLAVDDALRDIIDGEAYDLCEGVDILTISGDWNRRADIVLSRLETLRCQPSP